MSTRRYPLPDEIQPVRQTWLSPAEKEQLKAGLFQPRDRAELARVHSQLSFHRWFLRPLKIAVFLLSPLLAFFGGIGVVVTFTGTDPGFHLLAAFALGSWLAWLAGSHPRWDRWISRRYRQLQAESAYWSQIYTRERLEQEYRAIDLELP